MKHGLVTIQTYTLKQELYIAQGLLKRYGIESFTADENLDIIIGTPIAEGYRLQVGKSDEEKAKKIIAATRTRPVVSADNNYPKILVYGITFLFFFFASIHLFRSSHNFVNQYYNLNNTDRYLTVFNVGVDLVLLVGSFGIFF
jgi:hypothetical protein